jgi:hypothetical protein
MLGALQTVENSLNKVGTPLSGRNWGGDQTDAEDKKGNPLSQPFFPFIASPPSGSFGVGKLLFII